MSKLYDEILKVLPIVSYEEDREKNGHITLVEEHEKRTLKEGVVYSKRTYRLGNGKDVKVYITTIAPDAKAQLAVSASPLRRVKFVKQHAEEFDGDVLYAMNASFFHYFNNGDLTPYSIQIMKGVVMAEPGRDKPEYSNFFLGVMKDGTPILTDSDNYYANLKGKLEYAVGGGMMLIKDGEICLHDDFEYGPRTAVALAKDGTVILMCADGRSKDTAGLSNGDEIELYLSLGYDIENLLNLDGGGSTTVVLREEDGSFGVHNVPSGPPLPISYSKYGLTHPEPCGDLQARAVADAVLIIEKE